MLAPCKDYVSVTCVNLLCVCSEIMCCVEANTLIISTLFNYVLKGIKISILIDYSISVQRVYLLISIPVLKRNINSTKEGKIKSNYKYRPNICEEHVRGVLNPRLSIVKHF
jgi:hypothetical protein